MRLFFAIELPDAVRAHLVKVLDELRGGWGRMDWPKVTWTSPDKLHVTLKFLSEIREEDLPRLCDSAKCIGAYGPFVLQATHLQCFPPNGRINILTAGVAGDVEPLVRMYGELEEQCRRLGVARENRPYWPHITLGRARMPLPAPARGAMERMLVGAWPGPQWTAGEFVLVHSQSVQGNYEYVRLARFPLNDMGDAARVLISPPPPVSSKQTPNVPEEGEPNGQDH